MGAGAGNSGVNQARRDEAARQARMATGERQVNAAFDSPERAGQRNNFMDALRALFGQDAARQKGQADRRLKFANARSGLTGGSQAVDSNRRLGEEFQKGLVGNEARVQTAGADLALDDENARQSLISMIRGGADATATASRAMQLQSSNAQGAQSRAVTQGIGDIFGATADTYTRSEDAAARRRGMRDAQTSLYAKPFGA